MRRETLFALGALSSFGLFQVILVLQADISVMTKILLSVLVITFITFALALGLSLGKKYRKITSNLSQYGTAVKRLSEDTTDARKQIHNLEIAKEKLIRQQTILFDLASVDNEAQNSTQDRKG